MKGLEINIERLAAVAGRSSVSARSGIPRVDGASVVSEAVLAEAKRRYAECRCEDLGLEPGFPVARLRDLGAGCCSSDIVPSKGWVCPALDLVRSRYRRSL